MRPRAATLLPRGAAALRWRAGGSRRALSTLPDEYSLAASRARLREADALDAEQSVLDAAPRQPSASNTFTAAKGTFVGHDVLGNPVVLGFPRCADVSAAGGSSENWREVLAAGAPPGLSPEEERQWRQEVSELHSIDLAVSEYRARYAQVEQRHLMHHQRVAAA